MGGAGGVTALQPRPGPENPEKGENPHAGEGTPGFPPFSPFPGLGAAQSALPASAAAALGAVRAYRRTLPPKLARALRRKPDTTMYARDGAYTAWEAASTKLPGVPPDWCEGVGLLATVPAPPTILPRRWAALAASAFRLVRDHGVELHTAGWDALDLFGLHAAAPAANPADWGLAWLLGEAGSVLDVSADAVTMCAVPGGARLACRRRERARAGAVPAWELQGGNDGSQA